MSQIKCPNCGTVFQVDESQYHEILQQVRNEEFEKELTEVCGTYESDCSRCPKKTECDEYNSIFAQNSRNAPPWRVHRGTVARC